MGNLEFSAAIPQRILTSESLTVGGTNIVFSPHWPLIKKTCYGLELQFSSDTDVNVKVELEQGNYLPDFMVADNNFVVSIDSIDTVIDEKIHLYSVFPVVSVYARLKLTGLSGNSVTTKLVRANWVEVED